MGQEPNGRPRSDIIVVSDHGFAPFHTAVNINNLLAGHGLDPTKVRAITSGPAVNMHINLQGREPDGIVSREEYITLQHQIAGIFGQLTDTNPIYSMVQGAPWFSKSPTVGPCLPTLPTRPLASESAASSVKSPGNGSVPSAPFACEPRSAPL